MNMILSVPFIGLMSQQRKFNQTKILKCLPAGQSARLPRRTSLISANAGSIPSVMAVGESSEPHESFTKCMGGVVGELGNPTSS